MLVPHRGTPTWCFHTELHKFQSNVTANNLSVHVDEVVSLLIFYDNTNSWLLSNSLAGFNFNILWRDSKNRE